MKIRIYYEDTDAGGVVYHTNYIKYCERARSELFFKNNIPMNEEGYFVVKSLECEFIKPAKLGDIIEVRTNILKLKHASALLEQDIYKDDTLIFKSKVSVAYLSNGKLHKIPEEKLAYFIDFD
jgi:acyl-CoA thioester hydrolase